MEIRELLGVGKKFVIGMVHCLPLPGTMGYAGDCEKIYAQAVQDARTLEESGVDGLLIGRGALGNPWLFRQVKQRLSGEEVTAPTVQERVETALRHYDMLLQWKPERVAVNEMRKHVGWYVSGMRGAAQLRASINLVEDPNEAKDMLRAFAECAE